MRKILLVFSSIFFLTTSYAQLLTESFDVAVPPAGWTNTAVVGGATDVWIRATTTANLNSPQALPHSGSGMALYDSYTFAPGNVADLATPSLNMTSGGPYRVRFWMFRDQRFSLNDDSLEVFINTAGPASAGGTKLGRVSRHISDPPAVATRGWYEYTFNIPAAFNGATNYVIFKATSQYGTEMVIDDVVVEAQPSCGPPATITLGSVTNSSVSFSWATGTGATGYEWAVTTSATPPASGTSTALTNASQGGLSTTTQYYIHVRTACAGGLFSSWTTLAFLSGIDCSIVTNITGCNVPQTATIGAGTGAYSNNACGFSTPGIERLYTFTPAVSGNYTLNITAATGGYIDYMFKPVSGGCGPDGWTCIDDNNAIGTDIFGPLTAGTAYYILLDPEATTGMTHTFELLCPVPPPSCTTNLTPANGATNVTPPPLLSWNAAPTATAYSIFFGTVNPPTANLGSTAATSVSITGTTPNTTYYWYVQPTNSGGGATGCSSSTFSFTTAGIPINDTVCGAIALTLGGPQDCKSTVYATSVADPALPAVCSAPNNTLWYSYTPSATGPVIVRTEIPGATNDGLSGWLAWYTAAGACPTPGTLTPLAGSACQSFGPVAGDVDSLSSPVLTAGVTYYLMIDGVSGDLGNFCISLVAPPVPPATCATNTAPASGATGVIPSPGVTFNWSAVSGATSYTIFISSTNNPPNRATDSITTVSTNTVTLVGGFTPNTTYCWYVIPKNAGGEGPNCASAAQTTCFTTAAGPANDVCATAVRLTVNNGFCGTPALGNLILADSTTGLGAPTCATAALMNDVWYRVTIPATGNVVVLTSAVNTSTSDLVMQAYSGTCGALTLITCDDDGNPDTGPSSAHSRIALTGRTPGEFIYFRVMPYSSFNVGEFAICAYDTTAAVLPPIATGPNCVDATATIDSARKYMWTPLLDGSGNIVAELYPNGNLLGTTTFSYYINSGPVRRDASNVYYLDRNIIITPTVQPATGSPVGVRFYYRSVELDALQAVAPAVTSTNINGTKTTNDCASSANTIQPGSFIAQSGNGRYFALDSFATLSAATFSNFFLHGGFAALPVTLGDFRGAVTGNTNTLYWTTAQEQNNRKFVIERSADGVTFIAIGEEATKALNGTSSTPLSYTFVDASPLNGKAYYRLRLIDRNDRQTLSPIVTLLRGKGKFEIVDVRPNPTTGTVYFNLVGSSTGATVVVRSMNGTQVLVKQFTQPSNFSIDMSGLAGGLYILEATDRNGEKAVFKISKQ